MSESAATEFAMVTLQVDSLLPEDKSVVRCKAVPIDGATEGVRHLKPDKYDPLRKCAVSGPIMSQKYGGAETLLGNAACAELAVTILVFSIGHILGAHLNQSVTIALAVTQHFPWIQVPGHIAAQVTGSVCSSYVLKGVFQPFANGRVTAPSVDIGQVGDLAGIAAIGATVLLGILVTGMSTSGSLKPVRALGPAVAEGNYRGLWMYMVAPPLGAIGGAVTYTAVKLKGYKVELLRRRRISFGR